MLRIIWRAGFVCLALGALATGATVLGLLGSSDLEADEGKRVRLLVKCDRAELTTVLAALAETKAEIWDLASMKRVKAASPQLEAPPKKPKPPVPIPPLRDAGKVMEELLAAVASVKPKTGKLGPQVMELAIQPRRAMLLVTAASGNDVDAVRLALEVSPWLRPRVQQVMTGTVQRLSSGWIQTKLYLKFDTARPEPGTAVHLSKLDLQVVERAAMTRKMPFVFAGPEMEDPNRKAGHVTRSREFTLQTGTLRQLQGLIADLCQAQPGLVVFEVRWKDNGHGHLLKPIVRVGGRAPLMP